MTAEAVTHGDISAHLGGVVQLGFFVKDLEAAMQFWIETMGVRPFICIRDRVIGLEYENEQRQLHQDHGFGYLGDVQIELIHQKNDVPSPYVDFMASGRQGLNHLGFWAPSSDASAEVMNAAGLPKLVEIEITGQLIRFFDAPSMGTAIEVIPIERKAFRDAMQAYVNGWDGKEPIHRFGSVEEFLAAANG